MHADMTQDGALALGDRAPFLLDQKIRLNAEIPEAKQDVSYWGHF